MKSASRLGFDLLNFLQASAGDKETPGSSVVGQHLAELTNDMLEDVGRGVMKEGLQGGKMHTLLEDVLQGLLCLSKKTK